MAVATVSDSNNRYEDFEGSPTFASIGGGAGAGQETVTFLQGANSASRKVTSSSDAGFWVTSGANINVTTGDNRVWLCKILLYDYADLNSTGFRIRAGSSTSDYYTYFIADDGTQGDIDYPILGGWLIVPVDLNVSSWVDAVTATGPTLTTMNRWAVTAAVTTGAAKSENIFMDSIDFGDGLYIVGGDGASTDGVWQDFIDYDENSPTSGRIGHVLTREGIIFLLGKFIFGTIGWAVTCRS